MASKSSQDGAPGALRSDAVLNRERIVRAAREVFTERGIDAPLSAVARRAGVSVATLHRRFSARDDLVVAAFAEQLGRCTAALDDALIHPDPWLALGALVEKICGMQCAERGFTEAFFLRHPEFADDRLSRAEHQLGQLIEKGQLTGRVRPDVTAADVMLLLVCNAALVSSAHAPRAASARLVAQFLRAFDARGGHPLPPLPAREWHPLMQVLDR